ncbi:MAG: SRPBCC domain-containing protein [Pseudomonadota bacterium]
MTVGNTCRLALRHMVDTSLDDAFALWVTPEHVEAWWGPHGYRRTKVLTRDAVEGGAFVFQMTGASGDSRLMSGTYTRVRRPQLPAFEAREHCVADMPKGVRIPAQPSRVEVRFEPRSQGAIGPR